MTGKLQCLWVDDGVELFNPRTFPAEYRLYFEFQREHNLERLRNMAPCADPRIETSFDIAITDFNLIPRRVRNASLEADHDDQEAPNLVEQAGLQADAAGFLVGMLLAVNTPDRPKAILPYSGDARQFGAVWNLARHFAPHYIAVAPSTTRSKLETMNDLDPLGSAVIAFRQSLATFMLRNACALLPESEALLDSLFGSPSAMIGVKEFIKLRFANTTREFLVGALFFDKLEDPRRTSSIRAQDVTDFFRDLMIESDVKADAQKIADQAWAASQSVQSVRTYGFNLSIGGEDPPPIVSRTYGPNSEEPRGIATIDLILRSYVATNSVLEALTMLDDQEEDDLPIDLIPQKLVERDIVRDREADKHFWRGFDDALITLNIVDRDAATLGQMLDAIDRNRSVFTWSARVLRAIHPDTTKRPFPKWPESREARHTDFEGCLGVMDKAQKQLNRVLRRSLPQEERDRVQTAASSLIAGTNTLLGRDRGAALRLALTYVPERLSRPRFIDDGL